MQKSLSTSIKVHSNGLSYFSLALEKIRILESDRWRYFPPYFCSFECERGPITKLELKPQKTLFCLECSKCLSKYPISNLFTVILRRKWHWWSHPLSCKENHKVNCEHVTNLFYDVWLDGVSCSADPFLLLLRCIMMYHAQHNTSESLTGVDNTLYFMCLFVFLRKCHHCNARRQMMSPTFRHCIKIVLEWYKGNLFLKSQF